MLLSQRKNVCARERSDRGRYPAGKREGANVMSVFVVLAGTDHFVMSGCNKGGVIIVPCFRLSRESIAVTCSR